MHVGLNLIYLVPGETGGMEVYARELIPALAEAAPGARFTAFVNKEAGEGPWDEIGRVTVPVRASNRVEWVRGEQQLLPRLAAGAGCDLVHSLASTAPARGRFRRVTTIHDLIYREIPAAHFGLRSLGMRLLVPLSARRSHRLIVDAEHTRGDLLGAARVDPAKIDVVPLAVSPPDGPALAEAEVRRRHDLGERPFVLSVSAKRPHKNLPRLIEALALLPAETRPALVLPGYPTPHEAHLRELAAARGVGELVRFPAWVNGDELEGLYAAAAAFAFPSLYEGFGLPVLEAMVRGVPVACSDRTSLPEVAGDAALMFDPEDPAAIAAALRTLLEDADTADRLRRAGRERAARFTWERTARGTLASYERALAA